jgi:hypothetical protein
MERTIMDHVASLAQALEVPQSIVAGIMVEMCSSQDDAGLAHPHSVLDVRPARRPAAAVAPSMATRIEPTPVR